MDIHLSMYDTKFNHKDVSASLVAPRFDIIVGRQTRLNQIRLNRTPHKPNQTKPDTLYQFHFPTLSVSCCQAEPLMKR